VIMGLVVRFLCANICFFGVLASIDVNVVRKHVAFERSAICLIQFVFECVRFCKWFIYSIDYSGGYS